MKKLFSNAVLVLWLAVIADAVLILNVYRHWDDGRAGFVEITDSAGHTHVLKAVVH